MAVSLGEKLRSAREQRGISISEVAEQTRISPLYLEAIDADNYKSLPGGIFNKGFVRSYAKYVGVDEQEALQDYSRIIAQNEPVEAAGDFKTYRPEVLTDDRAASSIVPTIIFAAVILGLMTAGILFLVNYIQNQQSEPQIAANTQNQNAVAADNRPANTSVTTPAGQAPTMGSVKVEFLAVGDAVSLTSIVDGGKRNEVLLAPGAPAVFEPKESLKLRYSRSRAQFAQLRLNGKEITLPQQPLNPRSPTIDLEINASNLETVWQNASLTVEAPAVSANTNTEIPAQQSPRPAVRPAATPKPAASNGNTAAKPDAPPTMTGKPPARPAGTPAAERPSNSQERD